MFRHDTFGDEVFWTDVLHMNEVVQTIDPTTALAVGLKVDASVVPKEVLATADLKDPATTAALLSLGAVVGIEADGTRPERSPASASRARCAIRRWMIPSCPASDFASTGSRTARSTPA